MRAREETDIDLKEPEKAQVRSRAAENVTKVLKAAMWVAVVLVLSVIINKFLFARTNVDGNSMYPTLHDKDVLLTEKITRTYSRFDIITFNSDINKEELLIKRIIGLPGETVRIDSDGNIYINGKLLATDKYGVAPIEDPGLAAGDGVTLGPDEYFVMGDNRNRSEDSRFAPVGNIKKSDIDGKVVVRLWPFETFGFVDTYRERTQ